MTTTKVRRRITRVSVALMLWLAVPVCAAEPGFGEEESSFAFEVKGHTLWLLTYLQERQTRRNFTLNTGRLRLDTDVRYQDRLNLKVVLDLEAFGGNLVSSPFWEGLEDPQVGSFWDLSNGDKTEDSVFLRYSLYRAYVTYESDAVRVDAGKQHIPWGVMRFWRPTDLFFPESPLQIESGERTGVDAVRVRVPLLGDNGLECVYAPSQDSELDALAGKLHFRIGEYDATLVGGRIRRNGVLGLAFDGYVGDGGLRGEIVRVDPEEAPAYHMWVLGGDYSFPNTLTLTLEYLNNTGAGGMGGEVLRGFQGLLQTRQRELLGLGASYQFHPLLTGSLFSSYDLDGRSWALMPRLVWDIVQDLELSAGATLFGGKDGGEYKDVPRSFFFQVKLYF